MPTTDTSEKGLETLIVESLVVDTDYMHGRSEDYHMTTPWLWL